MIKLTLAQWNLVDRALCIAAAHYRDEARDLRASVDAHLPDVIKRAQELDAEEHYTRQLMNVIGKEKF